MSEYVKLEQVKELMGLINSQNHYIEYSTEWSEYQNAIYDKLREMETNAVGLENNSDTYNFTINFHGNSDVTKAEDFAKRFIREVKLNGGIQ